MQSPTSAAEHQAALRLTVVVKCMNAPSIGSLFKIVDSAQDKKQLGGEIQ